MGERIAHLRRNKGWSQAKLAKILGLSTSTIAMYEQGRREPPISVIITLAGTLGVTLDYLLTGHLPQSPKIDNAHAHLIAIILHTAWHIGK